MFGGWSPVTVARCGLRGENQTNPNPHRLAGKIPNLTSVVLLSSVICPLILIVPEAELGKFVTNGVK